MINNNLTRQQIVFINSILVVWSLGMAWLSLKGGVQHDYKAYITQWQLLLNGDPPWSTNNAYAPVHVVIGYLLPLHDLAPKFLFVISMLAANYLLVQDLLTIRGFDRINLVYLLCIPANILFIGMGIIYGLNDGFVAALLVFAVLLKLRSHSKLTGLFIGLAALMKFYPILLLPFFALDYKKINYEIIISGIVTFVAGFVAALIVWGTGPIAPVVFNSSRGPSLLSVLLALRTTFGETGIINFLIQYNTFFVIAGIIGTFAYIWCKNYSWLEGVVLGYLILLTIYKVGNQQFYIPFLFMVASLPLLNSNLTDRMAVILIPIVIFLSLFHYGYQFGSDGYRKSLGWVRYYGGYASFIINILCFATATFHSRIRKHGSQV